MTTTSETRDVATAPKLSPDLIKAYRDQGFVHIPHILTEEEVARFRQAALDLANRTQSGRGGAVFAQVVNAWREDDILRELTFHKNLSAIATRLAGTPLRLWHDQVLIKQPQKSTPTEFHQDQPFWPHANSTRPLSAWIALGDVPVERGCMTFLPGSHQLTELPPQSVTDPRKMFEISPELRWSPRVTVPLRAGDCTFHHACCVHGANANVTDETRVAHVVIFIDAGTTYTTKPHIVTDPLNLVDGQPLDHELFPLMRV